MAKRRDQILSLKELIDRADAIAKKASAEFRFTVREIRKEILALTDELDVGGSADDRDVVIEAAQRKVYELAKRLDRLSKAQMIAAYKSGFDQILKGTGVTVKYSKEHAEAVINVLKAKGGSSFAAVFTRSISENITTALRSAVVAAFQENAVAGGTLRDLKKTIAAKMDAAVRNGENFKFLDRTGRVWDAGRYFQMNVRTNTMRIYNDSLCDTITRATGSDLVMVSDDGGTADSCDVCQRWAGRILSITGKTKGFPTVDEARADGVFHPNCIHTLEPVDEDLDAAEIKRQRKGGK